MDLQIHKDKRNQKYLRQLQIKKNIKIFCLFILVYSCKSPDEGEYLYKDYNFTTHRGLERINAKSSDQIIKNKSSFVKIIYNRNTIDSIYFIDGSKKYPQTTIIRKYTKESIDVYHIMFPSEQYGSVHSYFVFSPSKTTDYFFLTPIISPDSTIQCLITTYQLKLVSSIMCSIKQSDTIGFINNLLHSNEIPINKVIKKYDIHISTKNPFTLLKLLNN